jgi:hypothetical protein
MNTALAHESPDYHHHPEEHSYAWIFELSLFLFGAFMIYKIRSLWKKTASSSTGTAE